MDAGILVPISFFGMVAAIVIVPRYFKSLERQKTAEALKVAIEKGQSLPPDIMETMAATAKLPPSPSRDLRTGIIWLGVGVGLACFGIALGFEEPEATFPFLAFAAFPAFIGLAFMLLGFLNRNKA